MTLCFSLFSRTRPTGTTFSVLAYLVGQLISFGPLPLVGKRDPWRLGNANTPPDRRAKALIAQWRYHMIHITTCAYIDFRMLSPPSAWPGSAPVFMRMSARLPPKLARNHAHCRRGSLR